MSQVIKVEDNWEGVPGGNEHRTVGPVRAWCYNDAEWCYPVWGKGSMLCHCCDQTTIPQKWRGDNVSTVLAEIREQVMALERVTTHTGATHDDVLVTVWLDEVLAILDGDD